MQNQQLVHKRRTGRPPSIPNKLKKPWWSLRWGQVPEIRFSRGMLAHQVDHKATYSQCQMIPTATCQAKQCKQIPAKQSNTIEITLLRKTRTLVSNFTACSLIPFICRRVFLTGLLFKKLCIQQLPKQSCGGYTISIPYHPYHGAVLLHPLQNHKYRVNSVHF